MIGGKKKKKVNVTSLAIFGSADVPSCTFFFSFFFRCSIEECTLYQGRIYANNDGYNNAVMIYAAMRVMVPHRICFSVKDMQELLSNSFNSTCTGNAEQGLVMISKHPPGCHDTLGVFLFFSAYQASSN